MPLLPLLTLRRVLYAVARAALRDPGRWISWVSRWAALLGFAYLKLSSPWDKEPFHKGDSRVWFNIGSNPWFSEELWFGYRPFTVPVIHKLFAHSEPAVVWFQSGLAIVSWAVFADAFSRCVHRRWLSLVALVSMLGLALTSPIHNWDVIIRSESASASLLVLTFGALLRALDPSYRSRRSRKKWWGALALVAAVFAAFARDTNSYILVLAAGFVLAFLVIARLTAPAPAVAIARARGFEPGKTSALGVFFRRRADLVGGVLLAGGLLLVSAEAMQNARKSERYAFPLMNVLFQRVLPKEHKLRYFREELEMPVSRALMKRSGKWAASDRRTAYKSPALAEFREWLYTKGYASYQRYLLAHPKLTFEEAYAAFPRMIRENFRKLARGNSYPMTERLDRWFVRGPIAEYPYHAVVLTFLVSAANLLWRRRDVRLLALFGLFAVGATVSQAYICYHGDAMEVVRHAVTVGVLARIGAVTALVLVLQAAVAWLVHLDPARTIARFLRALRPRWFVELRLDAAPTSSHAAARAELAH